VIAVPFRARALLVVAAGLDELFWLLRLDRRAAQPELTR
jgi:hypothetical protein